MSDLYKLGGKRAGELAAEFLRVENILTAGLKDDETVPHRFWLLVDLVAEESSIKVALSCCCVVILSLAVPTDAQCEEKAWQQ